jgi:8-oxo-dGTP pyrophosphatase MutT (NUDIX family)
MNDLKWETLSSEKLFTDSWFSIRKEQCRTPGGKIVDPYYIYDFPTWVAAELPGGCVDPADASHEAAIARELLEETGYRFNSYEYLGRISANPSTNSNLLHMYLARGGKKTALQQLDPNEEIDVHFFSPGEVKQMIKEKKIVQAMHVTALLYAFEKLGMNLL